MSVRNEIRRSRIAASRIAAFAFLFGTSALASAQTVTPRVELFGGYSYLYPNATLTGTQPGGIVPISSCMCAIPKGFGAAATFDFNRWLGITADFSGHWSPTSTTPSLEIGRANLFTYSAGPKFTYRTTHFAPFAEALIGAHNLAPQLFTADTKFGVLAGGGLDWIPTRHFGVRLVQADYVLSNHHFGTQSSTADTDLRGIRLQAGIVFLFGGHAPTKPLPLFAAAPAPPAPTPPPAPAPLTMACAANPSSMMVNETSTITATSPSTRALTYSYSATAGVITGTTDTAILSTNGAAPGTIYVTCNAVDDLGQTVTQTVPVIVAALPIAPAVTTKTLCSISFARDTRRPTRVNNEAKACLDDVALNLQRSNDARLILIGFSASASTHQAAERAANTKDYLVNDKGIDAGRITIYTGTEQRNDVTTILVPTGSTPDITGDTPINEATIKVHPR